MITRERQPPNLEMPFHTLDGAITPTENFYVRCHFPIPQINPDSWSLRIEGAVDQPAQFSLTDLKRFPRETMMATLECAGNGRIFLAPKVKGVQWELGAVGNCEWTGIRLSHLLEEAGIRSGAREVILEGADKGTIAELPRPTGEIHFARSVPIAKAMDDVLLALEMNGRPLTPAHGYPLRAIVPGWYGMASVKWLQRIVVTDEPFHGYYQTIDYAYWRRDKSGPVLVPLAQMSPKAQIARPQSNETIPVGTKYLVKGAAWGGEGGISKVEVSFDRGSSWEEASFNSPSVRHSWRLWSFTWHPTKPGNYTLLARATDCRGQTQPLDRNTDHGTYRIDHCLPVEVQVH
ncbi:MAG: sulfite oxidase [Verrucomicrobia bacterium]|nr:sulfite oxidase [Verrucomicrobiota bacterium]